MNDETDRALRVLTEGGDLWTWLGEQSKDVVERIAKGASEMGVVARHQQDWPMAAFAWMAAALAIRRSGDRRKALAAAFEHNQALFMLADAPESYQQVRASVAELVTKAREIEDPYLQLRLLGLSADCAYFAAQGAASDRDRRQALRLAMDDLLAAGATNSPAIDERFPSVFAGVVQAVREQSWTDDAAGPIEPLLRQLAAVAERMVPSGYQAGPPERTVRLTRELAELSGEFGDVTHARSRREAVRWSIKAQRWSE